MEESIRDEAERTMREEAEDAALRQEVERWKVRLRNSKWRAAKRAIMRAVKWVTSLRI